VSRVFLPCGRRRRLYVCSRSVRNWWSTCSELITTPLNIRSSASLYSSDRVGSSRPQYSSRRHRLTSDSSFAWSPAEHMPCHAGPAYVIFAKRVARKTSCSDASGMPWTRSAYSRLLHDASRLLTWSAADNWSLTVTPRMQMLLTRSMPGHAAGRLEKMWSCVAIVYSYATPHFFCKPYMARQVDSNFARSILLSFVHFGPGCQQRRQRVAAIRSSLNTL